MSLKILFFGDVIGKAGRQAIAQKLPEYKKKYAPDLIIANAENLAHGFGITQNSIDEMLDAGVDLFTSGNHVWDKKEGLVILTQPNSPVLRPHNYPTINPGVGYKIIRLKTYTILVINLMGRVFMKENVDCPFLTFDKILQQTEQESITAALVDFHAEATSEKSAFFHYANGRVAAVVGTHTHVATADLRISDAGTAFITDVGMNGPLDSVIGHQKEPIIKRFITQINLPHQISENFPCIINAVLIEINTKTGYASRVHQILERIEE